MKLARITLTTFTLITAAWLPTTRAAATPPPAAEDISNQGFLGLVVEKNADTPLRIKDVLKHGPAAAAGLQPDDQILAIDEIHTEPLTLDESVARLRGPIGSWVTLAIISGEDRIDLSIQRAAPSDIGGLQNS